MWKSLLLAPLIGCATPIILQEQDWQNRLWGIAIAPLLGFMNVIALFLIASAIGPANLDRYTRFYLATDIFLWCIPLIWIARNAWLRR
jgi:hypothetical protein